MWRAEEATGPRAHRPPAWKLVAAQVRYQLRLLVRSPMASFATLVVPLTVLLAVNLLRKDDRLRGQGNIRFSQFFAPAMVAFAVIAACYMGVIISTTLAREEGILKRIRSTPLPPWAYMAGRILSATLIALLGAVAVLAVGALVYDFEMVWSAVPGALLTIAVAAFSFCALALAVTVLVPSAEAALPIAWGTMLPLCFISDVFQPIEGAPALLGTVASTLPVRPFADDLESLFNPVTGGTSVHWGHLAVVAAWGVGAAAFALIAFRWEPAGTSGRGEGGSRGVVGHRAERLRALLETRTGKAPPPGRPSARGTREG